MKKTKKDTNNAGYLYKEVKIAKKEVGKAVNI